MSQPDFATKMAEIQVLLDETQSALDTSPIFGGGSRLTQARLHQHALRHDVEHRAGSGRRDRSRSPGWHKQDRIATSTPRVEQGKWDSDPKGASSRLLQESVKDAVDGYMSTKTTQDRCRVPPVSPPKFEVGGDWRCFLDEFREMILLADLKPSHQLAYFKQSVPTEAKRMLYQHKVESVQEAIKLLSELYEPKKDTWSVLKELERIKQKPEERLRVLAGRIEESARRYAETLESSNPSDLNKLVVSRFRHAIMDEETRNHLLWDTTELSLYEMVRKAQHFQDARQSASG